ncbi:MAG: hypothetical protein GEV03_08835 [Streptosporangiales bacterium]|nr:hypothetical protein [Streptosporangiales bacterium]
MGRADELRLTRERWQTAAGKAAARQVVRQLLHGESPADGPYGRVRERVDLRGLPLGTIASAPDFMYRRISVGRRRHLLASITGRKPGRWKTLDLSGADLTLMNWTDLTVEDCVFDDADLEGLRCWGVQVACCSMRRAKLFDGQLGAAEEFWPTRSVWLDVDLSQADLRGATAGTRFERVDFRTAKFRRTDFAWSDLVHCVFAGVVQGLTIGRRPIASRPSTWTLTDVDLTEARPRDLRLIGVDLGAVDVRLPEDAEHWHIPDWHAYLRRVTSLVAALQNGETKTAAEVWLDYATKDTGPGQITGFVAAWDLTHLGGQDLLVLLDQARSSRS